MWHYGKESTTVLAGKYGGKIQNTRPSVRWYDKIIVHLKQKET
jgi:hypothetical protein